MISSGVEAHKSVHAAVAVNEAGQVLGQWQGPNSPQGWTELGAWARERGTTRQWGLEGAWNYGRGLAQHLVGTGETVYEVSARWTARGRRQARRLRTTDERDAHALALLVWREHATLPQVGAEDATAERALLVTPRANALAAATRLRNQAHHLLLQSDPAYRTHLPSLTTAAGSAAWEAYQAPSPGALQETRAGAIRLLGQRLRLAGEQADDLKRQSEARAEAGFSPRTQLTGIKMLTAGTSAGLLGPGRRFGSAAELAFYAGVAPLEASSAGRVRQRLNRGGNRRLNAIVQRIALTQLRCLPAAQAYVERRVREGKTQREASRALQRYIVRAIWRLWQQCLPADPGPQVLQAA